VRTEFWHPTPGFLPERTDLDRLLNGGGGLGRPGERSVKVLGLDEVEAAEVLLRLREGAVGGEHLAVGDAHDGGGVGSVQGAAEDPGAGRLHLLLEDADPLHELPHLLLGIGSRASPSTLWTDKRYLAMLILLVVGGHFPPLTSTTNAPRPD
jgi:hypothetical protein